MIKEAIDRLLELNNPDTIEVKGDRIFRKGGYTEVTDPQADPIHLGTLTAFAAFVDRIEDNRVGGEIIHVISPTRVEFLGTLRKDMLRDCFAYAAARIDSTFNCATWHSQEDFVTSVQAHFSDKGDKKKLLKIAGNIRGGKSSTLVDDGTTQKVSTARGVELSGVEEMPNPVSLQPYETFAEIDQPIRSYIVRVRGDETPQFALFPIPDPMASHRTCMAIEEWLRSALSEESAVGILG